MYDSFHVTLKFTKRTRAFSDCPQGLESNAIPEYVYFGAMIATKMVDSHSDCLQHCVLNNKCKSVNYFEPMGKNVSVKHTSLLFCCVHNGSETFFESLLLYWDGV